MTLVNPIVDRWVQDARRDPDAFWAKAAGALPWFRPWDKVFDWTPPTFKWFVGARDQPLRTTRSIGTSRPATADARRSST